MKTHASFLVRCWLIRESARQERLLFEIQHIQTGNRRRAASLAEVSDWIVATTREREAQTQTEEQKNECHND